LSVVATSIQHQRAKKEYACSARWSVRGAATALQRWRWIWNGRLFRRRLVQHAVITLCNDDEFNFYSVLVW